ncbi:MAG: hypothetical protein Fur002_19550 [Anaerolineales bacterium]
MPERLLVLARLGRELSAVTDAESAALLIVEAADKLLGWDSCYLVLYDPSKGTKVRSILIMDTVNGKRVKLTTPPPDKPSSNMLRAIVEDGYLSLYDSQDEIQGFHSFGSSRHTLSLLFVPVRSGERVIGVFSIQSYQKQFYDEQSLQVFKALANQCAGALERIWAQEALADVEARRALIYSAIHDISASLALEQIYEIIYHTARKVMPCDDFIITTYDAAQNVITPVYVIEKNERLHSEAYPAERGLAAHVIRSGRSLLLNNQEDMNASGVDFIILTQSEDSTQSILAAPMILRGAVTGMISAQSYDLDAYTQDDQHLLELLGAHAAVAIENARLFGRVQQMADTDALTNIYNRRKFYDLAEKQFARAVEESLPLAVIMLDVDDFKLFNDTFGHKVGDFVLQIVTAECQACIREADLLARHGGEEFIVLLPNTDLAAARLVADRVREQVERANLQPALQFLEEVAGDSKNLDDMRVTVSVGVAALDGTCPRIDVLIDHADRAMYRAKESGRNQVVTWG